MSAYLLAAALPVALAAIYLVSRVPLQDLWDDLFVFPATVLLSVRQLPHPVLLPSSGFDFEKWVRFYFPLFVFLAALLAAGAGLLRAGNKVRLKACGVMLLGLAGCGYFVQSISRADSVHMLPARIPAVILALASVFLMLGPRRGAVIMRWLTGIVLFASVMFLGLSARRGWRAMESSWPFGCGSSLARAGCIPVTSDQEKCIRFIQGKVPHGQAIFVGLSRHDRIFANDILFYFLADRPSASKYHHLHPGVATTHSVQQQIIQELWKADVSHIVLYSGFDTFDEPNLSSVSSGETSLDSYIHGHYAPLEHFGDYLVMEKKAGVHDPK